MTELSNEVSIITKEINELAKKLGGAAWRIGKLTLGENANAKQIANYLSNHDFGIPGGLPPSMILNFMMRVKQNELS